MTLKADWKYEGTVLPGSTLIETQTGTLGYQVNLTCADGDTSFVIWLTEKNKDRAKKYFDMLGVSQEKLADPNYLEYGLGMEIEGRELTFGTKSEEYKNKLMIRVAWIGRKSSGTTAETAASFFGRPAPEKPPEGQPPSTHAMGEIPF